MLMEDCMDRSNFKDIVYAPVCIPNTPDYDNDVLTEEQIYEKMTNFMKSSKMIDFQHTLNPVKTNIIENYILPYPMEVESYGKVRKLPKGTWIMGLEILDQEVCKQIAEGNIRGFSITALQNASNVSIKSADKERITLKDLGDDFVIATVSLVENPAVYDALFFAFKSAPVEENREEECKDMDEEKVSFLKRIFGELKQFFASEDGGSVEQLEEEVVDKSEPEEEKEQVEELVEETSEEVEDNPSTEEEETAEKEEPVEEVPAEEVVDEEKEALKQEVQELKNQIASLTADVETAKKGIITKSEVLEEVRISSKSAVEKPRRGVKRDSMGRRIFE